MIDDEGVLFNPFSIGPPNSSNRYEYEMPTATTYPPPVFATWPPPKEHMNKSVSQGTLAEQRSNPGCVVFDTNSQKGQLPISKAINEEMTAAKQLTVDKERIGAGGESRTALQRSGSKASVSTMKTLMSFRTGRSVSKSSLMSKGSKASMAPSMKSAHSQLSTAQLQGGQAANGISSKMSLRSHASQATASNTTLKSVKPNANLSDQLDTIVKESATVSRSSRRSVKSEMEKPKDSRLSLRSKAGENAAEKVSRVSVRSQADNISRASLKSQADNISHASLKSQADNISRVSLKSQSNLHEPDNISRVSVGTRASEREADKVSRVSVRSKADERQADNISRVSTKAKWTNSKIANLQEGNQILKEKADTIKGLNKIGNANLPLKERAELVKRELSQSMESTKSLAHKAAELSERLRAGNEFKHNRFHTLDCTFKSNEPLKKCRDDRISIWFKDAVLS